MNCSKCNLGVVNESISCNKPSSSLSFILKSKTATYSFIIHIGQKIKLRNYSIDFILNEIQFEKKKFAKLFTNNFMADDQFAT